MIKRMFLIVLFGGILYLFINAITDLQTIYNSFGRDFFLENGYADTGSKNLVTGIYLDYRIFDSLFEAGILLIAVAGVMWISQHEIEEDNPHFLLYKYKTPELFVTFSRLIYPIMLIFGFYIVVNGHTSPGGGFQGGAIIATAILILFYIDYSQSTKRVNVNKILRIEKILFLVIIIITSVSLITRGVLFTNFFPVEFAADFKSIYLITLNILIGIKVALGMVAIFTAFLKEG